MRPDIAFAVGQQDIVLFLPKDIWPALSIYSDIFDKQLLWDCLFKWSRSQLVGYAEAGYYDPQKARSQNKMGYK